MDPTDSFNIEMETASTRSQSWEHLMRFGVMSRDFFKVNGDSFVLFEESDLLNGS